MSEWQVKLSEVIKRRIVKEEYEFNVPLVAHGGKLDATLERGTVSGKFFVKDPPRFAQLSGGVSTEVGTNGKVFLTDLEVPINYTEYEYKFWYGEGNSLIIAAF